MFGAAVSMRWPGRTFRGQSHEPVHGDGVSIFKTLPKASSTNYSYFGYTLSEYGETEGLLLCVWRLNLGIQML